MPICSCAYCIYIDTKQNVWSKFNLRLIRHTLFSTRSLPVVCDERERQKIRVRRHRAKNGQLANANFLLHLSLSLSLSSLAFGSRGGRRWRQQIIYFAPDAFHLTRNSTDSHRKKRPYVSVLLRMQFTLRSRLVVRSLAQQSANLGLQILRCLRPLQWFELIIGRWNLVCEILKICFPWFCETL